MAITFTKQPLNFFNVSEPAIFEFTTDADLGVNPLDLVADLQLLSLWTNRRYVIKNIMPNYRTGAFRVDVSGYLKSLMLDNFEYRFENPNKQYSIEAFSIGVDVHAESATDSSDPAFVFDSGYVFDETFIFADQTPNDTETLTGLYPQLGISQISEAVQVQKDVTKLNILSPRYAEYAKGFYQTLSVFVGGLAITPKQIVVDGIASVLEAGQGVSIGQITDAQIDRMYLPTLITTSLNNPAIPLYGVSYKAEECEPVRQIRFYTSYAGYSYFYVSEGARKSNRSKSEFVNNAFYNQQDGRSPEKQRSVDYTEEISYTGVKAFELQELFRELLRSPKIEILLDRGYTECKVRGQMNLRKSDFEYSLTIDLANAEQMTL